MNEGEAAPVVDERPDPGQYVVPGSDEVAPAGPPTTVSPVAAVEADTFRGRSPRKRVPGWAIVVGPLGSGAATFGALCVVAEAPPALSWTLVVVGVLMAVLALGVAHR
jgi:hypothetical protein